jgi:hypothetical protein
VQSAAAERGRKLVVRRQRGRHEGERVGGEVVELEAQASRGSGCAAGGGHARSPRATRSSRRST